MSCLLVIIPDRLSDLVRKGEISSRYYNPGNLFNEVHILMTNDDKVEPGQVQKAVGSAKLHIHSLPAGEMLFVRSLAWRPGLLRQWTEPAVRLAQAIGPSLVRCYGAHLNAFVAYRINEALRIPYVISLHSNPDDELGRTVGGWRNRISTVAVRSLARLTLRRAFMVLPVYRGMERYLERMGVIRYEIVHNFLNPQYLHKKYDYRLHAPVRILTVGRQIEGKNPENIIRAIARIDGCHLTMVGDGPYHSRLRTIVRECGMESAVTFHRSLANDELCREMCEFDIFAAHSDYWGVPKAVMEPLCIGLPVVFNRPMKEPVSELQGDFLLLTQNTAEGYRDGLMRLIKDDTFREELGQRGFAHAQRHWSPSHIEAKIVQLYERAMGQKVGM